MTDEQMDRLQTMVFMAYGQADRILFSQLFREYKSLEESSHNCAVEVVRLRRAMSDVVTILKLIGDHVVMLLPCEDAVVDAPDDTNNVLVWIEKRRRDAIDALEAM